MFSDQLAIHEPYHRILTNVNMSELGYANQNVVSQPLSGRDLIERRRTRVTTQGGGTLSAMAERTLPPIDSSLARVVVGFRVVGAAWLAILAATVLAEDDNANRAVVVASVAIVVIWSGVTWWLAVNRFRMFRSLQWLIADGVVAVWIAVAPFIAVAQNKFFGGYPMTWVFLAAYIGGVTYALPAGGVLAFTQIVGALGQDRAAASTVGDIAVFVISAVLFGWAVTTLRDTDARRHAAVRALEEERRERRLADERAEIGAHLHDSVLQTLALIEQESDTGRIKDLARSQDRDLRVFIDRMASPFDDSFAAAVKSAAAKVEDERTTVIEVVVVGDCELTTNLTAMVNAAREAVVNAAKYGGGTKVSVFAEVRGAAVTVSVRDRGPGFDVDEAIASSRGLAQSVVARMERHGGIASIESTPQRGTEVNLRMPVEANHE